MLPFTSCATTGERNKSGPRAPVASAPWQKAHDAVYCVCPRAASSFSGGAGRRCFLSGAGPFCAASGAAAVAGFCSCCGLRAAAVATIRNAREIAVSSATIDFDLPSELILEDRFILHPDLTDADAARVCGRTLGRAS